MKPTTMLYRNLMAMDVEESIRSNPFDAVVLIAGCDKTIPAQLMGAASADVPAIMLTGGPAEPARHLGRELGVGTDLWRYTDDLRAGRITQSDYHELEAAWIPTPGHCNEMGTASTMSCLVEALGMTLPGKRVDPRGLRSPGRRAEEIGARAVETRPGGAAAEQHPDRRGLRKRDHGARRSRRQHERDRAPAGVGRPRRGGAHPRPVRRDLGPDAIAGRRSAGRRRPAVGLRPGGRRPGAPHGALAAARDRCAHHRGDSARRCHRRCGGAGWRGDPHARSTAQARGRARGRPRQPRAERWRREGQRGQPRVASPPRPGRGVRWDRRRREPDRRSRPRRHPRLGPRAPKRRPDRCTRACRNGA